MSYGQKSSWGELFYWVRYFPNSSSAVLQAFIHVLVYSSNFSSFLWLFDILFDFVRNSMYSPVWDPRTRAPQVATFRFQWSLQLTRLNYLSSLVMTRRHEVWFDENRTRFFLQFCRAFLLHSRPSNALRIVVCCIEKILPKKILSEKVASTKNM